MTGEILWRGSELARLFDQPDFAADVSGISIDSRTVQAGDLFIALSGDPGVRFGGGTGGGRDGHDFLAGARHGGAAAVMVHRDIDPGIPMLRVKNTLDGLWSLGDAATRRGSSRRIAITGSSGKTTMRGWLERVLTVLGPTHASIGSLNNHWGVPLSLARMPVTAHYGVFEVGTNHPGEISPLSTLVRPEVALLLNVLPAHIGNFASMDALIAEKLSISHGLTDDGILVLPASLEVRAPKCRRITFGEDRAADVWAENIEVTATATRFKAHVCGETVVSTIPFSGHARVVSVLALLATCAALDIRAEKVIDALAGLTLPTGRGNTLRVGNVILIDDSYNANPASMAMAIDSLVRAESGGRKIAILGEMLELGTIGPGAHREVASLTAGLDQVISVGDGFADVTFPVQHTHIERADDLDVEAIASLLAASDQVLIKGSNRVFWQQRFVTRLEAALARAGN